jgi:insertion element IS1 protein InsB
MENKNNKKCPRCDSANICNNGKKPSGKQNHLCKDCGRQFVENPQNKVITAQQRADIYQAFQERISLRGICRTFKVSMNWLLWYLRSLGNSLDYQSVLNINVNESALIFELDEMYTFVGCKKMPRWIWIALDRATRQVVSYHIGKRDEVSCRRFWNKIPAEFRKKCQCFTDFWRAYATVIPPNQHHPQVNKSQTNHVERFNGTLRALCSRLVRKTYSFSRKLRYLKAHLNIIIYEYNKTKSYAV